MKTLHVIIANKKAVYRERDGAIVCENRNYQIEFTFDSEWDGYYTKTARFVIGGHYTDVIFSGNVCPVPIIRDADSISVGVYAGDLVTTTPATIDCQKSILCSGGSPEPPSDNVYAQIMEKLNQGGAIVPSMSEIVEAVLAELPTASVYKGEVIKF